MSEQDFNKLFARNLQAYMDRFDMSRTELASRLNVGHTTIYNWLNAIKTPRMSKVDELCKIFNCRRSDLISTEDALDDNYYVNADAARLAQDLHDNPDLRILFDAARSIPADDMRKVAAMIEAYKKAAYGDD